MLCPEGLQHKICEFGTHVSNSLSKGHELHLYRARNARLPSAGVPLSCDAIGSGFEGGRGAGYYLEGQRRVTAGMNAAFTTAVMCPSRWPLTGPKGCRSCTPDAWMNCRRSVDLDPVPFDA